MWKKTVQLLLLLGLVNVRTDDRICPRECICLSQIEVMCHSGGFTGIPVDRLPSSVEILSFEKNNFSIIGAEAFRKVRHLTKLTLIGNNITEIGAFAFRGVPRLKNLSISNTHITSLEPFSFAALQNITTIILVDNKIATIKPNAFTGTSNVNYLLLNDNPLVSIHQYAFSGLTNVQYLVLPSGIKQIAPDAFFGMDTVGLLKIPSLDLVSLQTYTFRGLSHVRVLQIIDSDLGDIAPNAFANLSHVDLLILRNNKIDTIDALKIITAQGVKKLRFHGNHILDLSKPSAIRIETSDELCVFDNYFPCDCRVHELLNSSFASRNYSEFREKNYCVSPLEVNGKSIASLDLNSVGRCHEKVNEIYSRASYFSGPTVSVLVVYMLYFNT